MQPVLLLELGESAMHLAADHPVDWAPVEALRLQLLLRLAHLVLREIARPEAVAAR